MKTERELRRERDKKAEAMGEGSWRNPKTNEWCLVEATFYPKPKLWITEAGARREITRRELEANYHTLAI